MSLRSPTLNGIWATEYEALKNAPLTRLLLLYCVFNEQVPL